MRAWYLTGDGARMVKDFPALRGQPPYPITSATAASLKTPHTLTLPRTHLAFAADARRRGDEHGFLDWTPEVSHPLGDGKKVITDALMHYTLTGPGQRTKLRAFIEVDRTTMSGERLASKLIDYARLQTATRGPAAFTPAGPGRTCLGCAGTSSSPGSRSSSPAAPGRSWTTGSAICRPWWPNIHSSQRWPAQCRWKLRCWTTSRRRGRPAKSRHR
ncbi:replication-relaxation family protein [Streptomyces werraensis]|uniref:replication-relaxation family protein n=1 Tax=Streptomyces werraensis TaxID=68284 RepID=UPI003F4B69AB